MIDFLLKFHCSFFELKEFLSKIFDCSSEKILIFDIDEFNSLVEELNDSEIVCICVVVEVRGDASQLLQLYRCPLPTSVISGKIISYAQKNKVQCYIPSDSVDTWIYVDTDALKFVRQIESEEEDIFSFKVI
ncbi:hypothetical protein [Massilia aquatica]|uniref:Uncharacterized protein n=1 Tax=Massilia aquatica TaxID=2609000 RepID=A0ABX0MEZ5_9BURK|nr:hypothetical protein [Massilia aquatica]NHZ42496.1 hypothetical protein [Massilia aquatica]